jgi:hypothetical protein
LRLTVIAAFGRHAKLCGVSEPAGGLA